MTGASERGATPNLQGLQRSGGAVASDKHRGKVRFLGSPPAGEASELVNTPARQAGSDGCDSHASHCCERLRSTGATTRSG